MDIVIQRVKEAKVRVNEVIVGEIQTGFLLLVGFSQDDELGLTRNDLEKISRKILKLRCFSDLEGKMNLNLEQVEGKILAVSQFTLLGDLKKGNRPSFMKALRPDLASDYFKLFCETLREDVMVEEGRFGEDMQVELINDGPVTFVINSNNILGSQR